MHWQRRTDTTMGCPAIGRREMEHSQRMHRDKIRSIKSAIDTRPPAAQPHLTLYGRDYVAKKRATTEAAFSDLKMIQSIARTMTRGIDIPERKGPISLTASSRKAEIFNIMKENHRLLNSLENLQPVTRTVDFERENEWRQRYVINCSHSKRLSGEYDRQIERIHVEDKAKMDKYKNTVDRRRTANRMASGASASMPSLTPMGSVDEHNQMSSSAPAQASPPARKNGGKVGPSKPSATTASSSSTGRPSKGSNQPAALGGKDVRFDAPEGAGEGSSEKMPATPYPTKTIAEQAKENNDDHELLVVDDKLCVVMQPEGGAGDAAPAEKQDEWADALMAPAEESKAPPKAPPEEEESVAQSQAPADTSSATYKDSFDKSGVSDAKDTSKDDTGYEDDYEADFADESMNTTSKSAKVEEKEFEEDEFEK